MLDMSNIQDENQNGGGEVIEASDKNAVVSPLKEKLQKKYKTTFEDSFSEEVWASTYKDHNDTDINDTLFRVAASVASMEKTPELVEEWTEKFYDMLSSFKVTAGGRIYANAGTEWGGTTLINCFTPDAKVLTSIGPKPICDVEVGDWVLTHKGRYRKVVNTMTRPYSGEVQRFRSSYFTDDIISTPEHPYYQGNQNWVVSKEVINVALAHTSTMSDSIVLDLAEVLSDKVSHKYVDVYETEINTRKEYIGGNGARGTKTGHAVQRFIPINLDFAYLLGRFVGDGCTFKQNKNSLFESDAFNIAFNATTEKVQAESMCGLFERTFGIRPNLTISQNNTLYVRKASQIVAEVLRRLVGDGFSTKRVPTIIWQSDKNVQLSFLRGVYDADGFVTNAGELQLEMTNNTLVKEIQTLTTLVGIPASRSKNRLYAGSSFSRQFRSKLSKHYDDDRLIFASSKIPTTGPQPLVNEGFVVTPERFDETYNGFVYNISVDEDESYVVNNVVVHNCFVGPRKTYDPDSITGILSHLESQVLTLKAEGGWGENFSYIRPRGAFIHGIGVETPGAVKYMELFDKSSEIITAGSGKKSVHVKAKGKIRKGAMMGVMDCWHPDVIEFITAKQQPGRLTKFNISVNCTDEFMSRITKILDIDKLIADELAFDHPNDEVLQRLQSQRAALDEWNLRFPDTTFKKYKKEWDGNITAWEAKGYPVDIYNTVSVMWLWNLIMESTYNRAEPGVLFLDRANYYNPLNYFETIFSTNPCGEQTLAPGNVCCLSSLNLTQFINKDRTGFDMPKFKKYVQYLVRFLDNVLSLSNAPLPEYKDSMDKKRRIGCGILGWGSALYMLKVPFGSEQASELRDYIMLEFAKTAYMTSIDLATEKGKFEYCNPKFHAESPFVKNLNLPSKYMEKLRTTGIRNSALLSIQPTGNTGVLANISSGGLEPVFLPEYIRTVIVNHVPDNIADVTPKWHEGEWHETKLFKFTKEGDEEILRGVGPDGTVYKIDKNRGLTKEVLCEDYGVRYLKRLGEWDASAPWARTTANLTAEDHVNDLKGFARWIDSAISKTVNLPNDYSFDNFKNVYLDAYNSGYVKGVTTYRSGTMTTVLSAKDEKHAGPDDEEIILEDVKLPDSAPATMKTLKAEGVKFYLTVVWNEQQNRPFALFVQTNQREREFITHDAVDRLVALARAKGIPERHIEDVLEKIGRDNNVSKIARTISLLLRHGVLIKNIVRTLEQVEDVNLGSFVFHIKKFLSSFIKDGEKVEGVTCENCGSSNVVYSEGCYRCNDCSAGRCS